MADTKISALTALTGANVATDDVLPIVDTSVTTTKKIRADELATYMKSALIGGSSLQLQYNNAGSFGGMSGTSWDDTNRSLTLTGATVTTSTPILDLSQTWNAVGVSFTALKINVTDTASASGSRVIDAQVDGSSIFYAEKSGNVYASNYYSTGSSPSRYGYHAVCAGNFSIESAGGLLTFGAYPSDIQLGRMGVGVLGLRGTSSSVGAALNLLEQTAPSAPGSNQVVIYAEDNGSGKTRLMARFPTGAAQQLGIEP